MGADTALTFIDLAHEAAFEVGGVEVRPSIREVIRGDHREILEPRIMQVLVALARRRGQVVSRNDLIEACWAGRAVGEDAINRCIAGVRRLAESLGGFSVETVVRVGFRLDELRSSGAFQIETASVPGVVEGAPRSVPATADGGPGRREVAILATDVVGSRRLAENDQAGVLAMVRVINDELTRLVASYRGGAISVRDDGAVATLADASEALDCALEFQRYVTQLGVGVAADRVILCRVGLHYGVAVESDGTLTGDAVNFATLVGQMAEPAAIVVSGALRAAAHRRPPMQDLGYHQLKSIGASARLWRLSASDASLDGKLNDDALEPRLNVLGGGRPTIAVLPFEHPADDREQTYLAEGIAEDVIAALTRFKWLFVLSRHSSLNYRKPVSDLNQLKSDLGVRYIVHGRLMCNEGKLRLDASLTDCTDGDAIWSRRFDGPIADIFAIQDEITATIVGALEPALMQREEAEAGRPATRSLKHWDLFIRGRWHFWQLTRGHVAKAHKILTQALALKPTDAPTLSLLAYTHFARLWSGWTDDPDAEVVQARRLAMRAVRLDRDDAFAHSTFGTALALTGGLDRAMAEQKRALELNPNFAEAMAEIGRYLAFSGAYDEAISYLDRAIRASPGDAHFFLWFRDKAIAAFTVSRFDEAVAFANEAAARRPDIFFNHYLLAASWACSGKVDKGKQAFAEGRRLFEKARQPSTNGRPISANYTLKILKFGHPFAHQEDLARYVEALRMCGWDG